jgi:nucleoside-diphosphate-sugar epimerase
MSRVLIAGAGYLGAATANLLHEQGWTVEAWTASAASAEQLGSGRYSVRAVDISNPEAVAALAPDYDLIVQSVSSRGGGAEDYRRIYLRGARNLMARFPKAALLFVSSTSVYAQHDAEWVTELSPAEPAHETGRVLREAEECVLAHGGTVARLSGIYGPGRSALVRKFLAGELTTAPDDDRFLNQVHRDDAAAALVFLATQMLELPPAHDSQVRKIYNVSDGHPISRRECLRWLAQHFGVNPQADNATRAVRKRGNSNKRVSSAKLQSLGWKLRYPTFAAGMVEVIPTILASNPSPA